jgi:hypothetical protein
MSTAVSPRADPELIQRWRQQIAGQRRRRAAGGPRALAAVGYLVHGPVHNGLVDIRRIVFVTLHDEVDAAGRLATRVGGFRAAAVPWGVKIGGPEHTRFEKDLGRPPAFRAKGRRFDLAHPDVLAIAMDLDRLVERHLRFPHFPRRRQPRWPTLWAAFSPHVAVGLCGQGPEFEALTGPGGRGNADLLMANRRRIGGLVAFPLVYVSHAWQQCLAIHADVRSLPKRQVITLEQKAKNLCGYSGAIEFDLLHSRFAAAPTNASPQSRHARTS